MGCASSAYAFGRKKKNKKTIAEFTIYTPSIRIPVHSDLFPNALKGFVPKDLAQTITSLRSQIVLVAEDTGASAITQLQQALQDYVPLLLGLFRKEYGLEEVVEFKWKNLEDGKEEICEANLWFELLSVLHMMAMLTLLEANSKLIPKDSDSCGRLVTTDCMRDAVDLLLKAAGYLDFCIRDIIVVRLQPDIKDRLPIDLHERVLEAILNQALAHGTEIQLSLALESQNATLSVKRRLACEQLSYFSQAHCCLSEADNSQGAKRKYVLFIKWKYLEAKAAAYYYHGLIVDKGTDASSHVSALCCFLAAEEILAESKRSCLSFCLSNPVTRVPPPWGVMKHLNKKIPETALKKSQMYAHLLDQQEKALDQLLPDLPEFQLSLKPDGYALPEVDSNNWDIHAQTLKDHLKDCDENVAESGYDSM